MNKYFSCLNITKLQLYDKGQVHTSSLCCNCHIVLGTVMYVVIGNLPNQSLRYEDEFILQEFGLKTEYWRN